MYSGTCKLTPDFILTEEQRRRVGMVASFQMPLSGRELDMKRASYLFIVHTRWVFTHSAVGTSPKAYFLAMANQARWISSCHAH